MSGRAAVLLLVLVPALAEAQTAPANRPIRRFEVSFGGGLLGGGALGVQDADLRDNSATAEPSRLFSTESRFAAAPAIDARAGIMLTRRYGVEGGFAFTHPELRVSISDDVEDAPPAVAVERIDQYMVDGAVVFVLEELPLGPLLPVVSGGLGYLRQLHEGQTVVEDGLFVHGGFGVRHWLTVGGRGLVKATGLRADARLYIVDGGIRVEGGPRPQGGISGSFFVVF